MIKHDDATLAQITAATPKSSTWLSANAGSGKTRVLTDRVARLLLDGVSPQNILCLTYTKAAASEMQNRLFKRLGAWTMLPDADLRSELAELGEDRRLDDPDLRTARTLFANAIETPGGLKIQTIHSFCAAILRRFPLEAGVSPQFREIDDRDQNLLFTQVLESLADENSAIVTDVSRHLTGDDFSEVLGGILAHENSFCGVQTLDAISKALGVTPGIGLADLAKDVLGPSGQDMVRQLIPLLLASGGNDAKASSKLNAIDFNAKPLVILEGLESYFLKADGDVGKLGKNAVLDALPFFPELETMAQRCQAAKQARLAIELADRTWALWRFGAAFVTQYADQKTAQGVLDFNDLIQKTKALLTDPAVAAWVLYRLDGGIDHILVDEAQDTSPDQWAVIELLAQEFTAGIGARDDVTRTVFVVGDKKQSIYSFQGADPSGFDRMREEFKARLEGVEMPFQSKELEYSFRSSAAVLDLVDAVFSGAQGLGGTSSHKAFKAGLPGRVDLWPIYEKTAAEKPGHWSDPVDQVSPEHQDKELATDLANEMKRMIAEETLTQLDRQGQPFQRPITAGDFLILVQGRKAQIFSELHRACKHAGLPIAGADQLNMSRELAVQDLLSYLEFLVTPEDSLALAEVLKSPLFGWSEQDLFNLSHDRKTAFLWSAMRDREAEFPATYSQLKALRDQAEFLRPYEILETILHQFGGRQKLLARLGAEAEEGIDELLVQAMAFERSHVPSLTGFLIWLAADDLTVKRKMEQAGDQIRVMTVHGAKGLESPIVILPETAQKNPRMPTVFKKDDLPIWKPLSPKTPEVIRGELKELTNKQIAERDRLLYVALTRAESWLIVAGSGGIKPDHICWYNQVQRGMSSLNSAALDTPKGEGLRFEHLDWVQGPVKTLTKIVPNSQASDPIFAQPAPDAAKIEKPLSPSDLGGAKALPTEANLEIDAKQLGTYVHALLEALPNYAPQHWDQVAQDLIADDTLRGPAIAQAVAVLNNPEFAEIFGDTVLAEVDFTSTLPTLQNQQVYGAIDRLLVSATHVLVVDFKTNQVVPTTAEATPEGVKRQMGAYAEALAPIYPNHTIETAILWTKTGQLMQLPHHVVMAALQNATSA